ncbi:MAG: hypothetical protein AAF192_07605, partial [Pseudomonadota bacterium]
MAVFEAFSSVGFRMAAGGFMFASPVVVNERATNNAIAGPSLQGGATRQEVEGQLDPLPSEGFLVSGPLGIIQAVVNTSGSLFAALTPTRVVYLSATEPLFRADELTQPSFDAFVSDSAYLVPNPRVEAGDTVLGSTTARDVIHGGAGKQVLEGRGGNDSLLGGGGGDTLFGGDGRDTLEGEGANDKLFGGDAKDFLFGDQGNDRLFA